VIGCCKWLDRPTVRLFLFHAKRRENNNKISIFLSRDRLKKKQVKEQIYLFLNKFRGYFFFYLLSWCSSPGSRSRKFLQLTPHNGRYPTSRGLNIFSNYLFFFIFDFYLNTFFFTSWCTFFGDVDDVTRKPSITQPVHLHFGIRQETNEEEVRRNKKKNKENCNLTWILNFFVEI
jgi:hypothetical protein